MTFMSSVLPLASALLLASFVPAQAFSPLAALAPGELFVREYYIFHCFPCTVSNPKSVHTATDSIVNVVANGFLSLGGPENFQRSRPEYDRISYCGSSISRPVSALYVNTLDNYLAGGSKAFVYSIYT